MSQAKLSFATQLDVKSTQAITVGNDILAVAYGGPSIRLLDFVNDENDELDMEGS